MLAPATQTQRVRCRQIAPGDLSALATLLAYGLPRSNLESWITGFARMSALPPVEGMPRFGYVLESESDIVGVLLLISSERPERIPERTQGRIMANLSSWYVEPAWRAHSTLLVNMATRRKDVTYLNASPAPHTWRTLQAQGFRPFNFGRSAVFPALSVTALLGGGGKVSTDVRAACRSTICCWHMRKWAAPAWCVKKTASFRPSCSSRADSKGRTLR